MLILLLLLIFTNTDLASQNSFVPVTSIDDTEYPSLENKTHTFIAICRP